MSQDEMTPLLSTERVNRGYGARDRPDMHYPTRGKEPHLRMLQSVGRRGNNSEAQISVKALMPLLVPNKSGQVGVSNQIQGGYS